jgi:radical SAM superfamily enzyme YgiQ (UPF0313 family)
MIKMSGTFKKKIENSPRGSKEEKVVLGLLPFWDPQIPPLGIACLQSFLQSRHYRVKSLDANLTPEFREIYDEYYRLLEKYVPQNRQGNIFNIGNQVLRNHLMAHHNTPEPGKKYLELLKILVRKTFFIDPPDNQVQELDNLLKEFYRRLRRYVFNLLKTEKPTTFGLSVYCDNFPASLAAFKMAKEWDPSVKTVMGGGIFADQLAPGSPNLDFFEEQTRDYIDKIIIGEGEELFLKFLQGELEETQKIYSLKDIGAAELDLSTLEIPEFKDFEVGYYPHLAHYGARSCPYQCKFCSETINWGKYRKKDVKQTVQEFIQLYKRYSYQLFLLTDSTLNPIASDLAAEIIEFGVPIYWDGFLRADPHVCSGENTMQWRRGGFYRAKLGLESASQHVLDLMNKRISVEQSPQALASLAYAGIKTTTFWLFGFPGETEADFQMTLQFIEKCKDNIYEADCNAFNYFLIGQVNSRQWLKNNKGVLLYPPWAKEFLFTQTWIIDEEPTREIAYQRVNRFVQHCKKLGIPNPYSLNDIFKADERWKKLHKNAVPSIKELKTKTITVEETRNVKAWSFVPNTLHDEGDWI